MTRFAEFMARRKSWQIFNVLVALMFLAQFYMAAAMPAASEAGQPPDTASLVQLLRGIGASALLMMLLLFSWLISICWVSNNKIDASLRPRLQWYFGAAIYAAVYIAIAPYFFAESFQSGADLPGIVLVLHVIATFAVFYVLAFSAKNLIMAERQSAVSFFDYSGPFFLMWFFPIGVWFVQPRVNRLVATSA